MNTESQWDKITAKQIACVDAAVQDFLEAIKQITRVKGFVDRQITLWDRIARKGDL